MKTYIDDEESRLMVVTAWAIGVKLLASEIQPVATRATAQSIGQSANCVSLTETTITSTSLTPRFRYPISLWPLLHPFCSPAPRQLSISSLEAR